MHLVYDNVIPFHDVLDVAFFVYKGGQSVTEAPSDFWALLSEAVSRKKRRNRIAVADSKLLYTRKKGIALLEEAVLAFLASRNKNPLSFRQLLKALGEDPNRLEQYPWYKKEDLSLPRATFKPLLKMLSERLVRAQEGCPFEFIGLRAKVLRAGAFNKLVERMGNKAEIGLSCIGEVLKRLFKKSRDSEVVVLVDRQGGRTKYARFLWRTLRPKKVFGLQESPVCSEYRIEGAGGSRLSVRFMKAGEGTSLPIALASMTAKYIRELHMELFNRYFTGMFGDGLRPTAGYVQDARRFLSDIETCLEKADFAPELMIRQR